MEIVAKRGTETVAAICPGFIYPHLHHGAKVVFIHSHKEQPPSLLPQVRAGSSSNHTEVTTAVRGSVGGSREGAMPARPLHHG